MGDEGSWYKNPTDRTVRDHSARKRGCSSTPEAYLIEAKKFFVKMSDLEHRVVLHSETLVLSAALHNKRVSISLVASMMRSSRLPLVYRVRRDLHKQHIAYTPTKLTCKSAHDRLA